MESDLTASEFLNKLNWSLLEHLVYSPDEAAASRSTVPENDRELRNLRFNYKEYAVKNLRYHISIPREE